MDIAAHAPATDDQELARVLESMNKDLRAAPPVADDAAGALQFEDTAGAPVVDQSVASTPAPVPMPQPVAPPVVAPVTPVAPPVQETTPVAPVFGGGELDNIKRDALSELRPLVDKLDLAPQEKFDTLLLIIRSTDDKSLVSAAHEAAKGIEDEGRRAAALLDVIKEIDYFSNPQS